MTLGVCLSTRTMGDMGDMGDMTNSARFSIRRRVKFTNQFSGVDRY